MPQKNTSFVKENVFCFFKDMELEKAALAKTKTLCQVKAACSCQLLQARLVLRDRTAVALTMFNNNAFKAGTSLVLAGVMVSLLVRCK